MKSFLSGHTDVVATSVASAMLMLASVAGAQSTECKINDGSPYQVNSGKQYVQQAANSKFPDQVPKLLQNAVRVLTDNPEKINNEAGRQYVLLRTYSQWMQHIGSRIEMNREELGFTDNPNGTQNLLLAIDSGATKVLTLMPECSKTIEPYRQRFLGEILNKSISSLNKDVLDSAEYYAKLSLMVASNEPQPWNVLTAVYQKRGQTDSAEYAMGKVIEMAGDNATHQKLQQQSRYNLAVLTLQRAETESGDTKDKDIAKARGLLEAYLKVAPDDPGAKQALGRTLRLSGDTAAVVAIFNDMVKSPEKFTDVQLFEAASNAAAAGQDANAVKLFESGLAKNPYHRVALLNLANVLFSMKDTEKMGPIVQRVMVLDPNYDTGWRLMAGYFQLRARAEEDPAKKKVMNDSVLFYLDRQAKTNPRVDINLAQKTGNSFELAGTVVNESAAAASYTMKFELVDETGAVVATKDVAVGPVEAKGNASFSLKVDAPKAVGFRYAPLR